jgi:hypothetical protein
LDWAVGGQRIGKLPSLPSLPRSFAHSLQMLPITAITSLRQPTRFENKNLALSATFLRLRILARLQKLEMSRQAIYLLRFCNVVDIQKPRNNPQSQKSCRKAGNFIFALPKRRY